MSRFKTVLSPFRSVVRLTKRYHKEERFNRIRGRSSDQQRNGTNVSNGHGILHYSNGANGLRNGNSVNGVNNGNGVVNNQHYNFPKKESKSKIRSPLRLHSGKRLEKLERQIIDQQKEIQSLKDCVSHLRGSLQLSDAQNLALQVLLKKMSKAESKLPNVEKSEFRNQMKKSEQQLENLVQELKAMSQTKYPTINSNNYSGSMFSFNGNSKERFYKM